MPTFGRYTLVRRVGTGGMAEIWKAKAQGPAGFEKILAIKKVLPHLVEDGEFVEMFVEEAKLVATLVHPNIVQVFDFGQVGKRDYFIAMEYVAGSNLAMILKRLHDRGARMPLEVALYVAAEACKGLGFAHERSDLAGRPLSIVHRDVSPQNILVSFSGEVKVTDFGIAKVASALSRTAEGHVRGKLAYMSPEQANTVPLDNRSDLFSLGVVLFEMLTGRRLFFGTSGSEIFAKVTKFTTPTDEELPSISYEVRNIVRTVLQPKPDDRYQDATQMEHALTSALGPDGIVQARHALASMLQRLFEDERKLEMTEPAVVPQSPPDESSTEAPSASGLYSAHSVSVSSSGGELAPTVATPAPGAIMPLAPHAAPTSASGLTLAPSSVKAVPGPAVLPTPGPAPKKRSVASPLLFLLFGVAALGLAVYAGTFLHRDPLSSTATPTAIAILTPEATLPPPQSVAATPVRTHAVPQPTRVALASHGSVVTQPRGGVGTVSIKAQPWVAVWVDGKLIADETPRNPLSMSAGVHQLRFKCPPVGFDRTSSVTVVADREVGIFVNTKTNEIITQPPK